MFSYRVWFYYDGCENNEELKKIVWNILNFVKISEAFIPNKVEESNGSYSLSLLQFKNKLLKFIPHKPCFEVVN